VLTILIPEDGEHIKAFTRRAEETTGEILLVLSPLDVVLAKNQEELKAFLEVSARFSSRLRIATRNHVVAGAARAKGLRVVDRAADLRKLLHGHPRANEAFRLFSPHIWRQQLRSRLQSMGLLSLPKLRVWTLISVSVLLFFFILFRLLPSAEVRIWPRDDTISQTSNIFLVLSGAAVDISPRVRTMELLPIRVDVSEVLTFDQISKEFIGRRK